MPKSLAQAKRERSCDKSNGMGYKSPVERACPGRGCHCDPKPTSEKIQAKTMPITQAGNKATNEQLNAATSKLTSGVEQTRSPQNLTSGKS